jgi:hypothetical protein
MGWRVSLAGVLILLGLALSGCIMIGMKAADAVGGVAAKSKVEPVRSAGEAMQTGVARVEAAERAAIRKVTGN